MAGTHRRDQRPVDPLEEGEVPRVQVVDLAEEGFGLVELLREPSVQFRLAVGAFRLNLGFGLALLGGGALAFPELAPFPLPLTLPPVLFGRGGRLLAALGLTLTNGRRPRAAKLLEEGRNALGGILGTVSFLLRLVLGQKLGNRRPAAAVSGRLADEGTLTQQIPSLLYHGTRDGLPSPHGTQSTQYVGRFRRGVAVDHVEMMAEEDGEELHDRRFAASGFSDEKDWLLLRDTPLHQRQQPEHRPGGSDGLHRESRGPVSLLLTQLHHLFQRSPRLRFLSIVNLVHVEFGPRSLDHLPEHLPHRLSLLLVPEPLGQQHEPLGGQFALGARPPPRPAEQITGGNETVLPAEHPAPAPSVPERHHHLHQELGVGGGTAASQFQDRAHLTGGDVPHVKLHESIAERPGQGLPSPVRAAGVLGGEQSKVRVGADRLVRLREVQLPIVVQQPIQSLEDLGGGQVQLVQDDPVPPAQCLDQNAVPKFEASFRVGGVASRVLLHVCVLVVVDADAPMAEAGSEVFDQRGLTCRGGTLEEDRPRSRRRGTDEGAEVGGGGGCQDELGPSSRRTSSSLGDGGGGPVDTILLPSLDPEGPNEDVLAVSAPAARPSARVVQFLRAQPLSQRSPQYLPERPPRGVVQWTLECQLEPLEEGPPQLPLLSSDQRPRRRQRAAQRPQGVPRPLPAPVRQAPVRQAPALQVNVHASEDGVATLQRRAVAADRRPPQIFRRNGPQLHGIDQLVDVNLREAGPDRRRQVLLPRVRRRVHRREQPKFRMTPEGPGVPPLGQRHRPPGVVEQSRQSLERLRRGEVDLVQ
mmetsp:Transcript_53170/g.159130  ORF Transcript_53170/g.159130 Transcript_53170/m.159130 type:complete len:809 (-) Transcript_53170:45-2471(-)